MHKNIIPNLVSLDTNLKKLRGFYLSEDFNFFSETATPNKFHYKLVKQNDIGMPDKYDFRNGYYIKAGSNWYYERKIFCFVTLKFCYDKINKSVYYNKWFKYVPFEIGKIQPIGKHLADIINLDLFFNDFFVFNGCSFIYNGLVFCLIGPSYNGKTTYVNNIIEKGGEYIAENIIILNFAEYLVFPTSCQTKKFERKVHKILFNNLTDDKIVKTKKTFSKIILFQNSLNKDYQATIKTLFDFFILKSQFFKNNNFILSYIFEENLVEKYYQKITKIKNDCKNLPDSKMISGYDFNKLI